MPAITPDNIVEEGEIVEKESIPIGVTPAIAKKIRLRRPVGPRLTNKVNPDFKFPSEPAEFRESYTEIKWGSDEHDELGKQLFKKKEKITESENFAKLFPRYSVVKQNDRASHPYARRKAHAFLRKIRKAPENLLNSDEQSDDNEKSHGD